jgi:hypothetical protein
LARINSIKDESAVLNLLLSYLKLKSMNVRYVAARLLLHLSKSSLIRFEEVRIALNNLMVDSDSDEDLWLIKEQDDMNVESEYYYAGSLRDVIYTLLVQHLTEGTNEIVQRNKWNDIDEDFAESSTAARLASCL